MKWQSAASNNDGNQRIPSAGSSSLVPPHWLLESVILRKEKCSYWLEKFENMPINLFTWGHLRADTQISKIPFENTASCNWGMFYSDAKYTSLSVCMEFYQPYLYHDALSVHCLCFLFKMTCTHTRIPCNSMEEKQAVEKFMRGLWWPLPPGWQEFVPCWYDTPPFVFQLQAWRGQGS